MQDCSWFFGSMAAGLLLVGLALSGCSSTGAGTPQSFSCGQKSTCPSDPAPTQAVIDLCNQELALCGASAKALFSCQATNTKCKADGTIDDQATND
jgi:hypothetical protein